MKKQVLTFGLLLTALAQFWSSTAGAQTDPKRQSRLEIKPKADNPAPTPVKTGFSLLNNPKSKDLNPQRAVSINQYYHNLLIAQPTRPAVAKPAPVEPVAVATAVSVEQKERSEEASNNPDKLFSNERLTVSALFPNPANDNVNITYSVGTGAKQARLQFFNVLGTPISDHDLDRNEHRLTVSTSDWANGFYLYQLSLDGRTLVTKKLLVRHQ